MKVTHLNPPELPDWSSLFSQVVIAEGSPLRVIAVSGQVGVDRTQAVSGDGGFAAQLDRAFENLVVALAAASCSVAEVVKLTIYDFAAGSGVQAGTGAVCRKPGRRAGVPLPFDG